MKPFDLEAAKRGEPIITSNGREVFFVGISKGSRPVVVCDSDGNLTRRFPGGYYTTNSTHIKDLYMAPKKRTVWVNLYPSKAGVYEAYGHPDKNSADDFMGGSNRIGGKAYPVEIEE